MIHRIAAAVLALLPAPALAGGDVHWSYEGLNGPDRWGELSREFDVCAHGREQSPVDLTGSVGAEIPNIALHWKPAAWEVVNNGHTIQLNATDAGHAVIDGVRYDLIQFHFHIPSEHAVDGRRFPMEAHFVRRAEDARLAVIGVMMQERRASRIFHGSWRWRRSNRGRCPQGRWTRPASSRTPRMCSAMPAR